VPCDTVRGMDILDFPTGASPERSPTRIGGHRPDPVPGSCVHERAMVGRLEVEICSRGDLAWYDRGEEIDPAVAMAHLFGQFDLVSSFDGLRTPGPTVFVYRPDGRRGRQAMRDLPAARWLQAAPELWITRDEHHLLLCPSDPVLAANLLSRSGPDRAARPVRRSP
jgi:hypothetical protein